MSTLFDYWNTGDDMARPSYSPDYFLAQGFTTITPFTINSVKLKLYRFSGGTSGIVTVSIRTTSSGLPTSSDLCSGTISAAVVDSLPTVAANAVWTEVTFVTPYFLSGSATYAIVLKNASTTREVNWRSDTSDTYSGGKASMTNTGEGSWVQIGGGTEDFMFECWGTVTGGTPPSSDAYSTKQLVTVASNEVWYESTSGVMTKLAVSVSTLDTSKPLSMFELYGKAFIVNETVKKVVDFTNVKLHTTDIVPAGTYPRHGTVITASGGTASGAQMSVDYITALDGDTYIYGKRLTTATFLSGDICIATIDEGSVSFTLNAAEVTGPHYYDWTVYGNSTVFGVMPTYVTLGCNYRGRAVISGDKLTPHQWYMFRQENPWDHLWGVNNTQSAVDGGDSDVGEVGDVIRALIPYKDDYLIFGCESTMWYLIGDPCDGGSINELDLTTGIYGPQSWCFDNEGNFYFFGTNGLYKCKIPGTPVCVSQIRLPDLVNDETVDPSTHRIVLSYDNKNIGINIFITKLSDGSNSNYWYDLRAQDDNGICGFFPETYPEECGVYSAFYYESKDQDYRKLLLGCKDGYLRFFDVTAEDDDIGTTDEVIDSFIDFGPIQMSLDPRQTGILTGLDCVLAGGEIGGSQPDSNNVYYKVFIGDSAEAVLEELYAGTTPIIAGTFRPPGRQRYTGIRKRVCSSYMGIRIGNNTVAEKWVLEQLLYDIKQLGKLG